MLLPERGYAGAIIQKTRAFAESMVRRDVYEWRQRLTKHVQAGRLSDEQAAAIIEAERQAAFERYIDERQAGKHNDHQSQRAGLIAYITDEAKYFVERTLDIAINPLGFPPPILVEVPDLSRVVDKPVYAMKLDNGGYDHSAEGSSGRMDFYPEPQTTENGDIALLSGPKLSVYPHSVIRIEGNGGELWQNPDYYQLFNDQESLN